MGKPISRLGWVSDAERNAAFWTREWKRGDWRVVIKWAWREPPGWFSRFGGGWKYELGFQLGGRTLIINLLFGYVRIAWPERRK